MSTVPRYGAALTIRSFALPELGVLLSSVVTTDQTFEEKFIENIVESVPEVMLDVWSMSAVDVPEGST
jgi:hypothetical protein